jgi:hypothetical protein
MNIVKRHPQPESPSVFIRVYLWLKDVFLR